MDENERVHAALGNEPRSNHGLAKGRRRGEHTCVVLQAARRRGLLFGTQFAAERRRRLSCPPPLVAQNDRTNAERGKRLSDVLETTARQCDVMRVILGARDHTRLLVGGQPHRLSLVELRILKCRQAKQSVPQTGMETLFGDVDLIAENQLECVGSAGQRRVASPARRRRRPGLARRPRQAADERRGSGRGARRPERSASTCARPIRRTLARKAH